VYLPLWNNSATTQKLGEEKGSYALFDNSFYQCRPINSLQHAEAVGGNAFGRLSLLDHRTSVRRQNGQKSPCPQSEYLCFRHLATPTTDDETRLRLEHHGSAALLDHPDGWTLRGLGSTLRGRRVLGSDPVTGRSQNGRRCEKVCQIEQRDPHLGTRAKCHIVQGRHPGAAEALGRGPSIDTEIPPSRCYSDHRIVIGLLARSRDWKCRFCPSSSCTSGGLLGMTDRCLQICCSA
jgi:hypothetical protein